MQSVLNLATQGLGYVSPNPLVGCIIVHEKKIIGKGWHQRFGAPHAEINAINSVQDKALLPNSTLYVNVAPCAHFGKTPPCVDLIIQHGIKKVVISHEDPNPLTKGKSIEKLRAAGVQVTVGILQKEAEALNRPFFTFIQKKKPYVILKWAATADGFIAPKNRQRRWISNALSRKLVHQWRAACDAILVGPNTALYDNPQLNVRDWSGSQPIRVLVDRHLRTAGKKLYLFDQSQPTLCYNCEQSQQLKNLTYIKLPKANFLINLLHHLATQQVQSLLVEGGGELLAAFIHANDWNEARVFVSDRKFSAGLPAPVLDLLPHTTEKILNDTFSVFYNT